MLRLILVAIMIACFVGLGIIDLCNGDYRLAAVSGLLAAVNGLVLWG